MLTHSGVKAHSCSECEKSFCQVGHLRRHMITHTGEKVHKCEECGDSFGQAGSLKRHKLIHSGEKPHKCTQCDYATAQTGYLRDHIKTHSTEKPNQCNWCEFSSITKKILPNIFSPTVERSHITVKSVGGHSPKQANWKGTSAFTLEKNLTSVQNAIIQVLNPLLSNNTWPNIQPWLTSFFSTVLW